MEGKSREEWKGALWVWQGVYHAPRTPLTLTYSFVNGLSNLAVAFALSSPSSHKYLCAFCPAERKIVAGAGNKQTERQVEGGSSNRGGATVKSNVNPK